MESRPESARVSLPSEREVAVARFFAAPRTAVFHAWTTPELLKRWLLGPPGWSMPVCEIDLRAGGAFRWRWRSEEDGSEFGFHGEFLEVEAPLRIRYTEIFDPGDTGETMGVEPARVTVTFEEVEGGTVVTTLVDYGTEASRDDALATGMTDGMEMSYEALDALLAESSPGARG